MRVFAESSRAFSQLQRLGAVNWDAWNRAADWLTDLFPFSARPIAPERDRLLHHLYLPVLFFCLAYARRTRPVPALIGLQAPQGSGKTTLARTLLSILPQFGLHGVSVSIDDFYLTRGEQLALAARHPGNPYLEHRGYPGTHDVSLGATTLNALRTIQPDTVVRVPVYDKSAHGGRGDRTPESDWREVPGPLDLVIVEGWMLGFEPVAEVRLQDANLVEPNRALAAYDAWHRQLDAFVVLRARDPHDVIEWRVEAEERMKAEGRPGLSRGDVEDYVRRFLPAYAVWAGRAPARFDDRDTMIISLDSDREPARGR
jgi:D-glycerate 3-kinase